MSKLVIVAVTLSSISLAHADVVEPTVEAAADEAPVEAPVRGPSMVAPRRVVEYGTVDETPPLSGGHVAGEVLLGGLFAVGGTFAGGYIGYELETRNGCSSEFCGLGGAILGGVAGLTFVTPVGVYLAGNTGGQTGSLGATIGGSVLGTLAGIAVLAAAQDEAAVAFLVIGPVAGSIIGFNATRKYERPRKRMQWAPVASVSSGNSTFGMAGAF